jgi:hypothetical protein
MKIINSLPPNYEEICSILPAVRDNPRIVFTYGDTIYMPSGEKELAPELMKHEETHSEQQALTTPDNWWRQYLTDTKFRFHQELMAYQAQYKDAKKRYSGKHSKFVLNIISKDLASPMYGKLLNTREEARRLIKS